MDVIALLCLLECNDSAFPNAESETSGLNGEMLVFTTVLCGFRIRRADFILIACSLFWL